MKTTSISLIILLLMITSHTFGQSQLKLFSGSKGATQVDYFIGDDVENFKTTLKGFGSIGSSAEWLFLSYGNEHFELFVDFGFSIRYYRFEKNLQLTKQEDGIKDEIVENSPYEFENTFFSWSKNKMIIGYFVVPVGFDVKFPFADLRLQASYTRYLSGKHKLKYVDPDDQYENKGDVTMDWLVGDTKEKYKTPNSEFKGYFLNKNNVTISAEIIPKINGERIFGIGFNYDILPLFMEGKGADIHEVSIYISFYEYRDY